MAECGVPFSTGTFLDVGAGSFNVSIVRLPEM